MITPLSVVWKGGFAHLYFLLEAESPLFEHAGVGPGGMKSMLSELSKGIRTTLTTMLALGARSSTSKTSRPLL